MGIQGQTRVSGLGSESAVRVLGRSVHGVWWGLGGGWWGWGRRELPQKDQVSRIVIGGAAQNLLDSCVLHWIFASHRGGRGCAEKPQSYPQVMPLRDLNIQQASLYCSIHHHEK